MPLKKGDLVLIDFTCKVKELDKVIDTTIEEVAKKEGLFREETVYEPTLVAVGEGWVVQGLDEDLLKLDENESATIEVPPEKGAGLRDPSKVKLMPLRLFKDTSPRPGMEVEVGGRRAIVRSVGSGRVQVDFNPPLAGKTLVYDVTIKKVLKSNLERVKALIHRRIPRVDMKLFRIRFDRKTVRINVPKEALTIEGLQHLKRGIAVDICRFIPTVDKVTFVESYVKGQTF